MSMYPQDVLANGRFELPASSRGVGPVIRVADPPEMGWVTIDEDQHSNELLDLIERAEEQADREQEAARLRRLQATGARQGRIEMGI